MSRSTTILRNVASNWGGFVVNAAVTLVLTPFVLHQLGPARYGVWILTASLIGYYGFLDLGFRAGVTQYLTRYLAAGEYRSASQCISSAVATLAALGLLLLGLSVTAAYLAPTVFDMPVSLHDEAFWCILIVGGSSAIQLALQPFTSVFTATQRFDLANLIGVSTRLLTAGGIVLALKSGAGLVGVSAATCAASVIDYVIRATVAKRLAPQLQIGLAHVSLSRVREVGAFGAWNFLISLNAFVYQHVPNLLIGAFLPIAAVGHYALATGLTRHINSVLSPVPQVLYPAATAMHVRGDMRGLERLYQDGSRLMLLILSSTVLMAGFWAPDFYRLWIGGQYLSGTPFHSVALLFQILLLAVATSYSSSVANQVLVGAGRVRSVATALIIGSVLNLSLSLVLVRFYGLAGIAFATVAASVVIDLIAMPILLHRFLGFSVVPLISRVWMRLVAAVVLQVLLIRAVQLASRPDDWVELIAQGLASGIAVVAVIVLVGIDASERQRFIVAPVRRLFRAQTATIRAASSGWRA